MSIIKTKCPDLVELSKVIGPIDGSDLKSSLRPLCDNIFDVQRGELFEVLERLRNTFWSDEIRLIENKEPVGIESLKRVLSEPDEDITYQNNILDTITTIHKKRVRLDNTPEPLEKVQKELNIQSNTKIQPLSFINYTSLWPFKKLLIRQIKNRTTKENELISFMNQIYQTKSKDQCRHMSLYLLPMAKAMRKKNVIDILNKWL